MAEYFCPGGCGGVDGDDPTDAVGVEPAVSLLCLLFDFTVLFGGVGGGVDDEVTGYGMTCVHDCLSDSVSLLRVFMEQW